MAYFDVLSRLWLKSMKKPRRMSVIIADRWDLTPDWRDYCRLQCDTVQAGQCLLMIRGNQLPVRGIFMLRATEAYFDTGERLVRYVGKYLAEYVMSHSRHREFARPY